MKLTRTQTHVHAGSEVDKKPAGCSAVIAPHCTAKEGRSTELVSVSAGERDHGGGVQKVSRGGLVLVKTVVQSSRHRQRAYVCATDVASHVFHRRRPVDLAPPLIQP